MAGNMAKSSDVNKNILPEFQKFLTERKLAPEKNIPFLAYWVSRFFGFAKRLERTVAEYNEITVQEFIETLRVDKRILDWQPKQAGDAIRLYYFNYLGKTGVQTGSATGTVDIDSVLRETKRLIRLKHYSYSTERTYLQWSERFLSYALAAGDKKIEDVSSADFKNFLSYLALKQRERDNESRQALQLHRYTHRGYTHP